MFYYQFCVSDSVLGRLSLGCWVSFAKLTPRPTAARMSSELPFLDAGGSPPCPVLNDSPEAGVYCPGGLDTPSLVALRGLHALRAAVRGIVQRFRALQDAELEVRLGTFVNGRFVADVPVHVFDELAATLQDQSQLLATEPPHEGHDIFIRLPPDRRVRIRSTTDELRLNVNTSSCIKTKVCELVVRTDRPDGLAFKIALSTEKPVPVEELGQFAETEFFRIRQTRRFTYGSSGGEDWAYDLTLVWSGRNHQEAEAAQVARQQKRELEIELIGQDYIKTHDDSHIADSVLCKGMDLVRRGQGDLRVHLVPPRR